MFRVKEYFASLRTRAVLLCASAIALGGVSTANAAWNPSNPNPNHFDSALIMQEIAHPHSDLVTIAAHRGIHALAGTNQAPKVAENSLQAIGYAAQEGWEAIEIDVKLTSDGVPILSHDKTWGREWCYGHSGAGAYDPFTGQRSAWNLPVNGTDLSGTRSLLFTTFLRDSVSLYCGNIFSYREYAPTLDDVYDYLWYNNIQMVITLDVQSIDIAAAAWRVVQSHTDRQGRSTARSTVFKIPANLFRTTNDFKQVFGDNYRDVRFNPVFHTAFIAPNQFGSEQAMIDWIWAYQADPSINIVAIEVTMKDPPPGGILSNLLSVAGHHTITGFPVTLSNFNPVGEYYPPPTPQDPQPQAAFFSSTDGHCCVYLSEYLFNNKNYQGPIEYPGLPYDHLDHRQSVSFLVEDARAQMITTDRPDVLQTYLLAHNRRNICHLQTTGCPGGAGGSVGTRNHGQYTKPLRVLPIGDSITWGWSSSTGSGYRGPLRTALINGGFDVDFVGSITSGTMTDPYNEGHPGWRIEEIAGITTQVVQKYKPNVVLLKAGTNDMVQGYQLDTAANRLGDLIEQIVAASPTATVLVASLIPSTDVQINNNINAFNAKLPELVAQKRRAGLAVYLVDMSSFPVSDLADVVHPNDAGYQRMANLWLPAIRDVSLAIEQAVDCSSIPAGCNDPAIGSASHGPGPRLPAHGWTPAGSIASGTDIPGLVQYVDMNGDGKADYVVMDPATGKLTVYMNNGTDYPTYGGWGAPRTYAQGAAPASQVQLADVNGDGKADYLIVDPSSGAVNAWLNNGGDQGGGGWSFIGQVARGAGPGYLVRFADLTGDGRADYIVLDFETGAMQVWRNNGMDVPGGGGWVAMGQVARGAAPATMVRFADINNDHLADYLVLNPVTGAVLAWLNNGMDIPGSGGWTPLGVIAPGTGAPGTQVQFADLNGDGATDYLVVGARGQTNGWLNNGGDLQSNLPPPHLFATPSVPKGPLPRNGWTPVDTVAAGTNVPGILDYVDMNGDRKADFTIRDGTTGALTVYMNNGTDVPGGGGWGPPIAHASGAAPGGQVVLADVSGDGRADYLILDPSSGSVKAWLNNGGDHGGGGWIYLGKVAAGAAPSEFVRFADLNGDGYADYLVVDRDTGAITAWLNNGMDLPGGGGWTPQGKVALGAAPLANVRFADLNNDKRADYLVVDQAGAIYAWLNNGMDVPGGNGWASLGTFFTGIGISEFSIQLADVNGDGAADYLLMLPDEGQKTYGWLNNGGDTP